MTALIVAVVVVVLILSAVGIVAIRHAPFDGPPEDGITLTRVNRGPDLEQYAARTPAGPAVITRVWGDDRGEEFELETDFTGPRRAIRLHYCPPHLPVARRDLAQLAAEHLARRQETSR